MNMVTRIVRWIQERAGEYEKMPPAMQRIVENGWPQNLLHNLANEIGATFRTADFESPDEEARIRLEAQAYHRVMRLLRDMRMQHGNCEPKLSDGMPRACTRCAAKWELDQLVDQYRGGIFELC